MKVYKLPLEWFTNKLNAGIPFAFARYGDGEFQAILGWNGKTKDGQTYTPELREALAQTLLVPCDYKYAVGPMALRMHGPDILTWLENERINLKWYDTEVFLEASINGTLRPFIDSLRARNVLYFAPRHLHRLSDSIPSLRVHECDGHEAYSRIDQLLAAGVSAARKFDVMLFSCGPASKVLVYRLKRQLPRLTLIDIGSLFDPYFGVYSRTYMKRQDWQKLARLNLGG